MTQASESALPPGDYAIVEVFGHTTLVGRIAEVERFGAKMLAIEPIFAGVLLPMILQGGASIYRLTPCSAETAAARAPRERWAVPEAIRAIIPAALLEAPRAVVEADEGAEDPDDPESPL
jgi:hypothetical protein